MKKTGKDAVVVDDHDEMGIPRPIRLPRKADMSNALVKEYAQLMALNDADLVGNPPATPYELDNVWLDGGLEVGEGQKEQSIGNSTLPNDFSNEFLKKDDMAEYFAEKKEQSIGNSTLPNDISNEFLKKDDMAEYFAEKKRAEHRELYFAE